MSIKETWLTSPRLLPTLVLEPRPKHPSAVHIHHQYHRALLLVYSICAVQLISSRLVQTGQSLSGCVRCCAMALAAPHRPSALSLAATSVRQAPPLMRLLDTIWNTEVNS